MADQPNSWAALLSSIAAILNAVAWPAVTAWFLISNRSRIAYLLRVFAKKLDGAKKLKLGQLELEGTIEEAITEVAAHVPSADVTKTVPEAQREAAVDLNLRVKSSDLPRTSVLEAVRSQIYELANEYERVRSEMPSNHLRTRRMNEIAAGMRTLAIAALPLRTELIKSQSIGKRLAAICILQVEPRPRYFKWLIERIKTETQPFVFYQASVAILELVSRGLFINLDDAISQISEAICVIASFSGGPPDQNTLDVLNEALTMLKAKQHGN